MDRLARQRRATTMSTWTDAQGMWNLHAKFDPVTALGLAGKLDQAVEAFFAEATPDTCPSDPVEKQAHLRALALARLMSGSGGGGRSGDPEYVVVIDADQPMVWRGPMAGGARNALFVVNSNGQVRNLETGIDPERLAQRVAALSFLEEEFIREGRGPAAQELPFTARVAPPDDDTY